MKFFKNCFYIILLGIGISCSHTHAANSTEMETETAAISYDKAAASCEQTTASESPDTEAPAAEIPEPMSIDMEDGEYAIEAELYGGSGKAAITSPTVLTVQDGKAYARIEWSSSNYDYMIVGTEKYLNENDIEEGRSIFTIPVADMDTAIPVIADTTAMGTPHEISYTLTFYSDSIGPKSQLPQEAAKRVVALAFVIIIGGGLLNHFINKKRRC